MTTASSCVNRTRQGGARALPPAAVFCALTGMPRPAAAQVSDGLGALVQTDFLLYAIIAVVLVLGFIVAVVILRKLNLGRGADTLDGLTYLDVTGMKKTGLLTDEEAARVRLAMQKQVERQRLSATRAPVAGELGLLTDPEVQRLEAEAEARQKMGASARHPAAARQQTPAPAPAPLAHQAPAASSQMSPSQPAASPAPSPSRPVFSPRHASSSQPPAPSESAGDLELGMMGGAPARSAPPAGHTVSDPSQIFATPAPAAPSADDDVPLPPDVVKMADLGLITPDELERIKSRIREKRQGL